MCGGAKRPLEILSVLHQTHIHPDKYTPIQISTHTKTPIHRGLQAKKKTSSETLKKFELKLEFSQNSKEVQA